MSAEGEAGRSDVELCRAWTQGDRAAAGVFAQRHFAGVFRFFRTKVPDLAEELTQRTFLAFRESLEGYRFEGTVRAYLFGVARRQLLRHYEGREDRGRERVDLSAVSAFDLMPTATQVIAAREAHDDIVAALQRLPVDAQIALELFYWNDLSVAEMAHVLAAPTGTVKSRLSRARARLREELQRSTGEPELSEDELTERTRRARPVVKDRRP